MFKKILFLSLLILAACDPKDASVASKPFEQPSNDGFQTLSMQEPMTLNRPSWFFWKRHEDMATVLKLSGGLKILSKNIEVATKHKLNLQQQRDNYLLESLGPDNKVIWEELQVKSQLNASQTEAIRANLQTEESKPEEQRDMGRMEQWNQQLIELQQAKQILEEQIAGVEQQSGVGPEFNVTLNDLKQKIETETAKIQALQQQAQTYQQTLAALVELVPDAPKLILQERDGSLYIELVDFAKDGVACTTETGLIRDVVYQKDTGYIEFTAICKQPSGADPSQLVSYKIMLEKIPSSPTLVLSGNMARCIDKLPNLGKCEAGLSAGVVEYNP